MNYIEDNLIGETQGALRKDRRVENHIFSIHELLAKTFLAFLVLSSTFDKVLRFGIFIFVWKMLFKGNARNNYVLFMKM